MTDDPNNQPWIQTLPGLMTAAATLITAVSGLVVGVHQLSSVQAPESPAPSASPVASPDATAPAVASPAVSPEAIPSAAPEEIVDKKGKPEGEKGGKKK